MPITIYTETEIAAQTLAYFRNRFPDKDSGDGSWLDKIAKATGMALYSLQKAVLDADHDSTPNDKSSEAALEQFAVTFGLSDGAGNYGRKQATFASGGVATLSGTKGTTYTDGLVATASDGVTQISLSGTVTIPGSPPGTGTVAGSFVAVT